MVDQHGRTFAERLAATRANVDARNFDLERAIETIIASLKSGGAVYACGNGGSDAHAGHLAAELIGRFAYDRPPLRAVHLSSGGPVGSCIANDYGWEQVFARQVEALCGPRDVLVCFSTSGASKNIRAAIDHVWNDDGKAILFTSRAAKDYVDSIHGHGDGGPIAVYSSATGTPAIQEEHQEWVHLVAEAVEKAMFPK